MQAPATAIVTKKTDQKEHGVPMATADQAGPFYMTGPQSLDHSGEQQTSFGAESSLCITQQISKQPRVSVRGALANA